MLDVFTTREIATGIYVIVFFLFVVLNNKFRASAFKIIKVKAIFERQLVISFIIILLYASIILFCMTRFVFWKWIYLKDILIWVLFVGVPVCFKATDRKIESDYFRNMIIKNIKLSVFLEFFLNTFTFSLIIELVLQAVLIFLTLLQVIAQTKERHRVKKKLDAILVLIAIILFYQTLQTTIAAYPKYDIEGYIINLLIPLVFSVIYVPVAYLMAVYSRYQLLFDRIRYNKNIIHYKMIVFFSCGLSIKNIVELEKIYIRYIDKNIDEKEFNSIIDKYRIENKTSNKKRYIH